MVNIHTSPRYKINRQRIVKIVDMYFNKYNIDKNIQINIVFSGMRKIKQIAEIYKKKPTAHPVLTFSYKQQDSDPFENSREKPLGEIFICYPQAVVMAAQRNKTVNYIIDGLVIHGLDNLSK